MGQAMQEQTITLTQINRELTELNLPILSRQRASHLQGIAPREKLISAIFSAKEDMSARQYIVGLFQQTGIFSEKAVPQQAPAPQQGQQAPRPQQAPAPQQGQQAPRPQQAPAPQQGAQEREYGESLHVYGGKAALCFEEDSTKSGFPTISIDGATASAPRNYDWSNKIRIQLTKQELPAVAAVLVGAQPKCSFTNHGPQNDKGFELERQDGGKVYVKVFGGNGQGVRGVPVMPSDLFYVTSLVLRQLLKSMPGGSINDVLAVVWATQSARM